MTRKISIERLLKFHIGKTVGVRFGRETIYGELNKDGSIGWSPGIIDIEIGDVVLMSGNYKLLDKSSFAKGSRFIRKSYMPHKVVGLKSNSKYLMKDKYL